MIKTKNEDSIKNYAKNLVRIIKFGAGHDKPIKDLLDSVSYKELCKSLEIPNK